MGAITALSVLLLFAVTRAQLIPSLPDLPSPSPAASQSPLPAIVQEALESIVSELATPTPTPANASPIDGDPNPSALPAPEDSLPATAVPVLSETSLGPVAGNIQPESPDFVPEDSESDGVVESLAPDADENSSETEAESPPRAEFYVNGVCVRDVKRPRPVLGNSQVRSALTVISSAAALACASILYGLAADWEIEEEHVLIRLLMILLARVLTIGAVKLSAALVAAITKTSPEDGALDASGAFLTWGTAIFTRLYYEGFKMTMVAIGFINSERVWDRKLRDYLNPEYLSLKAFTDKDRNAGGVHAEEEEEEETIALRTESVLPHSGGNLPIMQRLLGGRIDRKLLMLCTLGYFASELSVLVANLLGLIGAFSNRARAPNYFAEDALGGQCGIQGKDWLGMYFRYGFCLVRASYALLLLAATDFANFLPQNMILSSRGRTLFYTALLRTDTAAILGTTAHCSSVLPWMSLSKNTKNS